MACQLTAAFDFNDECFGDRWKPEATGVYFMKALTVQQPFAGLIETGQKKLEIRSRATKHRGKLLICAGAEPHKGELLVYENGQLFRDNCRQFVKQNAKEYPLGVMVCAVDLVDCRPMVQADEQDARHGFVEGAFVWVLENPRIVYNVEIKGQLGLFNVDANLVRYVML